MLKGPIINILNESHLNLFHEKLLFLGKEADLEPTSLSDKAISSLPTKKETKGILKKNFSKKKTVIPSFFKELNKIKLVKQAIKKLRKNSTLAFSDKLKKNQYQIIGDPINEHKIIENGFEFKVNKFSLFFSLKT